MLARIVRCVALAACFAALVGCAEVNYRGGVVAQVEDWVLFRAVTKSHRLLRSYTLAGTLMAVTRTSPSMTTVEKTAISGRLRASLQLAQEAYFCLQPTRYKADWTKADNSVLKMSDTDIAKNIPVTSCIFFDSRMTELDYSLYKLAAEVLIDPDSASAVASVRNQMLGIIPPVQKAVLAGTKAVEAANHAAGAVFDVTSFVNALIQVGATSGGRWVYLLPIYRDLLEFDMRLMLQLLRWHCKLDDLKGACDVFNEGIEKFNNGNGDMAQWRDFIKEHSVILNEVEAYPFHFALVTRWIYNSCAAIYGGDPGSDQTGQDAVFAAVKKNCYPMIEYTDPPVTDRRFTVTYNDGKPNGTETFVAKRRVPSQFARPETTPAPAPAPVQNAKPAQQGTTGQSGTPH